MARKFNYTGTCIPGKHYMVDISQKIKQITELIEEGDYFTINRPRQYGKSTILLLLEKELMRKGYLVIPISFEGIGDTVFETEISFCKIFIKKIAESFRFSNKKLMNYFSKKINKIKNLDGVSSVISNSILDIKKDVVLLIDEVDKSSNNQLFLSFIGMLRDKYLRSNSGKDYTFKSVILTGVHDVKTLKVKIRPDAEQKYNSPWNIAVDFTVDLSFSPDEISTMLIDYAKEKHITMEIPAISEKFHYFTSGYPFLVSKLCYIIDNRIMGSTPEWKLEYVEQAVEMLLSEDNTNFQSLIKNLENNQELYNIIKKITLDNEEIPVVKTDPAISLGITYGILRDKAPGICRIHNRIYSQLIYDHMIMGVFREKRIVRVSDYNFRDNFIQPDGGLDFEQVLKRFQTFMREQYSEKDTEFLERNGRLVFLAFIKPIINGKGYDFKEVQISEEKRLDIVITYGSFRYIVELKIWKGPEKYKKGMKQLINYLEKQHSSRGYLIIFDFKKKKEWKQIRTVNDHKEIFAVWV